MDFRSPVFADTEVVHKEICRINLARLFWLNLCTIPFAPVYFAMSYAGVGGSALNIWNYVDVITGPLILILTIVCRKKKYYGAFAVWLILTYSIVVLVNLTGYYSEELKVHGEQIAYLVGVMMVAVFFIYPPKIILLLFITNHIVFIFIAVNNESQSVHMWKSIFGNSLGFVLAVLAAFLLYRGQIDRIRKEQRLTDAKNQIQTQNQTLIDILETCAHNFRSPLKSLLLFNNAISKEDDWKDEPYHQILKSWDEQCRAMLRTAEGLLTQGGSATIGNTKAISINAKPILESIVNRMMPLAHDASMALELNCTSDISLPCSTDALEIILDNLISNSIHYCPIDTHIIVSLSQDNRDTLMEVSDNGEGLPQETADKAFEKYYRGTSSIGENPHGLGIGLFLCKQLVEQNGGRMEYVQAQPHGSIFRIRFAV